MLNSLRQKYEKRKALRAWKKSPIGEALIYLTQTYFYAGETCLTKLPEANKCELIEGFWEKLIAIEQAENPFLATRELIGAYVCEYSRLQVLCLTQKQKAAAFYSNCPYISGNLSPHIQQLSQHNDDLKQLILEHGNIPNDELTSFCYGRATAFLYFVNGLNIVRRAAKDLDETKDWFQPFVESMLICEEDISRGRIGLPSLLPDIVDPLRHHAFLSMVTEGHENPYISWEKAYKGTSAEIVANS